MVKIQTISYYIFKLLVPYRWKDLTIYFTLLVRKCYIIKKGSKESKCYNINSWSLTNKNQALKNEFKGKKLYLAIKDNYINDTTREILCLIV